MVLIWLIEELLIRRSQAVQLFVAEQGKLWYSTLFLYVSVNLNFTATTGKNQEIPYNN